MRRVLFAPNAAYRQRDTCASCQGCIATAGFGDAGLTVQTGGVCHEGNTADFVPLLGCYYPGHDIRIALEALLIVETEFCELTVLYVIQAKEGVSWSGQCRNALRPDQSLTTFFTPDQPDCESALIQISG